MEKKLGMRSGLLLSFGMALTVYTLPASSSGAFIHLASAEKARSHLSTPLRGNLSGEYKQVYFAGVAFPDAMLQAGGKYGSWAHFGSFHNDAAKLISENCKTLEASFAGASCKQLIAFFLGALSHVRVDSRFDARFVTKTKEECFKGKDLATTVQKWTDENLDSVAACKHRDYYRDSVIGKDKAFNILYPTGFILRVAQMNSELNLTESKVKDAYKNWLDETIGKENKLVNKGVFCETILATGAAGFENPWQACPWGSDEQHYWSDKSVKGSVADLSQDILPGYLQPAYDKLVKSLGAKAPPPQFEASSQGWPDKWLCPEKCK